MRREQEATLIVRSLGPQIVQIKTHRLKPLPTEAAARRPSANGPRVRINTTPKTEATPQPEPAIVLTAVGKRVGRGMGLGLRGPFAIGRRWNRRSRRDAIASRTPAAGRFA